MRVVRVRHGERTFYASLSSEGVSCLDRTLGLDGALPLESCQVLPPVLPTKIVCAGINYRSHALEMGHDIPDEPVLFFKPPSAVIGVGQPIILPRRSKRVDYEGELAIVIGRACRDVSEADVPAYVFGYACANDVTARDLQKKDGQWARAKGFDTFAPIGPWIETQVADPDDLTVRTLVNGETRQEGHTGDMIVSPHALVAFVSTVMTLYPGDVILTGTPSGIGPLFPGDEVRVEIPQVGVLINPVLAEDPEAGGAPIQ